MVGSAQNSMGVIHDVQLSGHRNLSAMCWNANIDFTPLLGKVLLRVPIALGKLSLLHLCTKTYTTHFPSWNQLKLRAVSLGRKSHCISPNPMSVRFLLPKVVYSTGDADLSLLHTVGLVCFQVAIISFVRCWWSPAGMRTLTKRPKLHFIQWPHSKSTPTIASFWVNWLILRSLPLIMAFFILRPPILIALFLGHSYLRFVITSEMDVAGLVSVSSSDIKGRNAFKCTLANWSHRTRVRVTYCLVGADTRRVGLVTKECWVLSVMPFIKFSERYEALEMIEYM